MKNFEYNQQTNKEKKIHYIESICYSNFLSAQQLEEHRNNGIELCVAFEGTYDWTVENKVTTIRNQEISITLPWQNHSGRDSLINKGKLAWIIIRPDIFKRDGSFILGEGIGLSERVQEMIGKALCENQHINIGKSQWFVQLLLKIIEELKEQKQGYEDSIYLCLAEMFIEVLRLIEGKKDANVESVDLVTMELFELIESMIEKAWTIQDLESLTHLKKTALNKYFKKVTGFSPMNYVLYRKIEHSKNFLISDELSITDIAYQLNFSSSQHFSTTFKKFTGLSPREFRCRSSE